MEFFLEHVFYIQSALSRAEIIFEHKFAFHVVIFRMYAYALSAQPVHLYVYALHPKFTLWDSMACLHWTTQVQCVHADSWSWNLGSLRPSHHRMASFGPHKSMVMCLSGCAERSLYFWELHYVACWLYAAFKLPGSCCFAKPTVLQKGVLSYCITTRTNLKPDWSFVYVQWSCGKYWFWLNKN